MTSRIKFSKTARAGMLQSVFMLAFFTVFWAVFLFWGFRVTAFSIVGAVVFVATAGVLFYGALKANRVIRTMPDAPSDPADKRAQTRWNIIASVQGGAIGVSCAVLWGMAGALSTAVLGVYILRLIK